MDTTWATVQASMAMRKGRTLLTPVIEGNVWVRVTDPVSPTMWMLRLGLLTATMAAAGWSRARARGLRSTP
jgi:hypothetical protein